MNLAESWLDVVQWGTVMALAVPVPLVVEMKPAATKNTSALISCRNSEFVRAFMKPPYR